MYKSSDLLRKVKLGAAVLAVVGVVAIVIVVPSLVTPRVSVIEQEISKNTIPGLKDHEED